MPQKNQNLKPGLDVEAKVFNTLSGVQLRLRVLNPMMLSAGANLSTKPEPPKIEISIGKKNTVVTSNPGDPAYQRELDLWQSAQNVRTTQMIFVWGVENDPEPKFAKEYRDLFPEASDSEVKYAWVCSVIDAVTVIRSEGEGEAYKTVTEMDDVMEAIMGQNMVTNRGLAEVAETFPGDG